MACGREVQFDDVLLVLMTLHRLQQGAAGFVHSSNQFPPVRNKGKCDKGAVTYHYALWYMVLVAGSVKYKSDMLEYSEYKTLSVFSRSRRLLSLVEYGVLEYLLHCCFFCNER